MRHTVLIALGWLLAVSAWAQDRLELTDGSSLDYYLALPNAPITDPLPLVVFMGGGSGDRGISYDAYRFYARDLASLGWVVAVPVSPDNRSFRGGNVAKVLALVDHLQARPEVRPGRVLVGGISAGGMSALEIANRHPTRVAGVLAVPAIVREAAQVNQLAGMPVFLRIGGDDELGWAGRFTETMTLLTDAGAVVDGDIYYGEPHMFGIDWTALQPWMTARFP